jgi:DNA polymerase I-like protein with 3'-5' exonuclease and polymerase domains
MNSFLSSIDGLSKLKYGIIPNDAQRGYFIGLDGRVVKCDSEHLMLAGYLQNGESVIMKWANRIWYSRLKKEKIWFRQVNDVHDEWQTEVEHCLETARYVAYVQRQAIRQAGEELEVKCRLDGSSEIGYNWLETH